MSNKRTERSTDDCAGCPAIPMVVAASAINRTAEQCAGARADYRSRCAAAAVATVVVTRVGLLATNVGPTIGHGVVSGKAIHRKAPTENVARNVTQYSSAQLGKLAPVLRGHSIRLPTILSYYSSSSSS